eukprot:CAMPEP_0197708554 /NCGR_PEP_ID=MMETSP1338-20131121/128013_1 /TAXON_ID=43686 ORGANISM="Pelagodinium beii, Strain RCC1491" /NCGR_SAMPLE_ID=MMETSP1338 /ASSEMBLY_ACC=CAM_ASM_000754 /LENGTH=356 /DNA_ID=CAMNT_0043292485 /DNA_START=21 /DNA_END=1091 /DNA_ORIENTATION=-
MAPKSAATSLTNKGMDTPKRASSSSLLAASPAVQKKFNKKGAAKASTDAVGKNAGQGTASSSNPAVVMVKYKRGCVTCWKPVKVKGRTATKTEPSDSANKIMSKAESLPGDWPKASKTVEVSNVGRVIEKYDTDMFGTIVELVLLQGGQMSFRAGECGHLLQVNHDFLVTFKTAEDADSGSESEPEYELNPDMEIIIAWELPPQFLPSLASRLGDTGALKELVRSKSDLEDGHMAISRKALRTEILVLQQVFPQSSGMFNIAFRVLKKSSTGTTPFETTIQLNVPPVSGHALRAGDVFLGECIPATAKMQAGHIFLRQALEPQVLNVVAHFLEGKSKDNFKRFLCTDGMSLGEDPN